MLSVNRNTTHPFEQAFSSVSDSNGARDLRRVIAKGFFAGSAAVLVALSLTGCSNSGDSARARARIVFLSDRLGTWAGYSTNADGKDLRSLDLPLDVSAGSSWSPDGSVLAFVKDLDVQVVVLDRPASLHKLGCGITPSWSADGGSFVSYCGARLNIVSRDSWRSRAIDAPELVGAAQAISPDGKEVAYVAWDGIATMHADGTGRRIAVDWARSPGVEGNSAVDDLQWSPDGRTLAYTIVRVGPAGCCGRPGTLAGGGLFLVSSKGGDARRVLARAHDAVTWSPSGDKLAASCGNDLCAVEADGKHPIRLAASTAGEQLHSPVWSPDSRRIVYLRNRFRGEDESDVFVVGSEGSGDRRITRPFPHGGSYVAASWATGASPSGTIAQDTSRKLLIRGALILQRPGRIDELAADATSAAWIEQSGSRCRIGKWRPHVGAPRTSKMPSCSIDYPTGENTKVSRLELGDVGAIWLSEYTNAHDDHYESLALAAFAKRRIRFSFPLDITDPRAVVGVVGGGGSIVFATAKTCNVRDDVGCRGIDGGAGLRFNDPRLWHLAGNAPKPVLITAGRTAIVPAAVGGQRIVVITPAGPVDLLRLDGTQLQSFRFARGSVLAARISGNRLVLLRRNGFIEEWSISHRLRRRGWRARGDASTPPVLEGAEGDYAVYVAGMAIHILRLSDGADRVVPLANGGGPVHAELSSRGLFFSYRELGAIVPSRIVFLPWRTLRGMKS